MIPASFDYHQPGTLDEAFALLREHGDEAKVLSGGQSLLPMLKLRLAAAKHLVDIGRIPDLEYVREEGGYVLIGGRTRESALEESDVIRDKLPILVDTARVIADPLVRNMATVGGNLAHADPANDHPAVMLAYGAEVVARGPNGERVIPIDDFFVDLFATSLKPNEILTEIRIPRPPAGSGEAYVKVERKVGDYAVSAVAVQLRLEGSTVSQARIALTNVSPVPMRATDAEGELTGKALSDAVLEAAGRAAAAQSEPSADLRGSEDYKRDLTRILTRRAIQKAAARARGEA